MSSTYYVQRLEVREGSNGKEKGIDKFFGMDYMGSAEFEFGALPTTLRRMRADEREVKVKVREFSLDVRGVYSTFFVVSCEDHTEDAVKWFKDQWFKLRKLYNKEASHLRDAYGIEDVLPMTNPKVVGWWRIDRERDVPSWAVFKDKKHATQWLKATKG